VAPTPRSEDPKLIIRVINFELVKARPICPLYVSVIDRQTDRRTDDLRITIAIPRYHYEHRTVKTIAPKVLVLLTCCIIMYKKNCGPIVFEITDGITLNTLCGFVVA